MTATTTLNPKTGTWAQSPIYQYQNQASLTKLVPDKSLRVFLEKLSDPEYELLKAIPVVVESTDSDFVASFLEANINASGESQWAALRHLGYLVIDVFEMLMDEEASLAALPARQLEVLRSYLRK